MPDALDRIDDLALFPSLTENGWQVHFAGEQGDDAILAELRRIADLLGTRVAGRAGLLEEVVRPLEREQANPRSLSASCGLDDFPLHIELSHRVQPCRFVLLACLAAGEPGAVTRLLDWRLLDFSAAELDLLEQAPVLVRNGRQSFYTTLLPADRRLLRYDPGCIEAVEERGRTALGLVAHRLAQVSPSEHVWRRGEIIIIDNWRVLHGRGPSFPNSNRRLARILIDV